MKWIIGKFTEDDRRYNDKSVKCSACGHIQDYPSNYCPDCGEKYEKQLDNVS